jgi:hypothetical protein
MIFGPLCVSALGAQGRWVVVTEGVPPPER